MEKDDRYQKGKIYQVVCNVTGKCYIGSTRQTLSARLSGHRDNYNKYLKGGKAFCKSYHIIENDDYQIELIEEYPCYSKMELERQEGRYQRDMVCVNKVIAGRTDREYRVDNQDKIKERYNKNKERIRERENKKRKDNNEQYKERDRIYYHDNKERITERRKMIYNCECGGTYREGSRAKHKRTAKHIYFETHNEILPTKDNIHECECGGSYTISHRARHKKTKKHQNYINSL